MPAEKAKNLPFIYLDCGTEDGLITTNREFSALAYWKRKFRTNSANLPGIHDWKFWNAEIKEFLEVSERFLNTETRTK